MIISSKRSLVQVLTICTVVIGTISATVKHNDDVEKKLFNDFTTENFTVNFKKTAATVILNWIIFNTKRGKKSYGNKRLLNITKFSGYKNAEDYAETIEMNKSVCTINKDNSSMAVCGHEISNSFIEACKSYKIVLGGSKHTIYFTTGNFSIAKRSPAKFILSSRQTSNLTLILSLDEKFLDQECGANILPFEMRLFYNLSSTVQKNVSCIKENNSADIRCVTAKELGDEVSICNQPDLHLEVRPVFFNSTPNEVEPFKVISQLNVTNLSTLLEKNNVISNLVVRKTDDGVHLEWNVSYLLCTKDLSLIELTVNGKGQYSFNAVIPTQCINKYREGKWNIEFNRMSYTCGNTRKRFDRELEPCTEYVITVHQSKSSKNNLSQTIDLPLKPQDIKMNIDTSPDIRNLRVDNVLQRQFQLSWEISSLCQNFIKSDTLVQVKNKDQPITMTTKMEVCNATLCNVTLTYNEISACTLYTVYVDQDVKMNIGTSPDIWDGKVRMQSENNGGVVFNWNYPECRQEFLGWQLNITSEKSKSTISVEEITETTYRIYVNKCETYNFSISAKWEKGRIDPPVSEVFKTECLKSTGSISKDIEVLLAIGVL